MRRRTKILTTALLLAGMAGAALLVPNESNARAACPRFDDKPTYMGADGCKKCHFKQHSSWKKTVMASSFDKLKPDVAAEAKKKAKLDEKKDYTKDAKCLPCHTTGYGKDGGYPAVVEGKAWTEEETKRAAAMQNVQCEACHGPGSLTSAYKKDHEDFKKEDVMKLGMINPDQKNCETCHNDKSPFFDKDKPFKYDDAVKDATKVHQHVELKKKH